MWRSTNPMPCHGSRFPFLWLGHLVVPASAAGYVVALSVRSPVVPGAWRMIGLLAALWLVAGLAALSFCRGRDWARRHGGAALASTVLFLGLLPVAEGVLRYRWWGGMERPRARPHIGHRFDHPTRGWAAPPHVVWVSETREFEQEIEINSRGFRDVEHDLEPQPGVFRIVVLGDSFMEADEVALEESFVRRLEARLIDRHVETINLGVRAYGTAQELITLEEVGLAYRPDLVVLGYFLGNDTSGNSRWFESNTWGPRSPYTVCRPYATIDPDTGELVWTPPDLETAAKGQMPTREQLPSRQWLLLKRLPVPSFLGGKRLSPAPADRWDENIALMDFALSFDPSLGARGIAADVYRTRFDEAWAVTLRLLTKIRQLSADVGAPAVLMVIPPAFAAGERTLAEVEDSAMLIDPFLPSRRLAETADVHGMLLVDLVEPMRQANERGEGSFYFPDDGHWTANGHQFAADVMAEYLVREGLVPLRGGG